MHSKQSLQNVDGPDDLPDLYTDPHGFRGKLTPIYFIGI